MITDILFTLIFLVGICYLVLFRFKQYRMDKFRQNIFAVRDDLFDYAAKGNIAFNHPAYVTLRRMLNGYIRFSHRISLLQVIVLTFADNLWDKQIHPKRFKVIWKEATSDLDKTTKNELNQFLLEASASVCYYVFLSSFLKKIIVIPFLLIGAFINAVAKARKTKIRRDLIVVESEVKSVELFSYKHCNQQVKYPIEHLNTDALVIGTTKTSVSSNLAAV